MSETHVLVNGVLYPTICPECQSGDLSWSAYVHWSAGGSAYPAAALGCNYCSETVVSGVDPDLLMNRN